MKHFLLIACIAVVAFTASAQDSTRKYVIEVGDFVKLKITDDLNVTYRCNADSAGLAVFTATQDEAKSFIFKNNKSTLTLQMATEYAITDSTMPHITVYSSTIDELENKADSTLIVENVETSGKIKLKLTDNGRLIATGLSAAEVDAKIFTGKGLVAISGKCDKASLKCTGTGMIDAIGLVATDVNCRIIGTGSIYCRVAGGSLTTRGSGPGKVYFTGIPAEIKSRHIGRLKTIPMTGNVNEK